MSLPDKVAVLSDVHGNIPALEAVLTDIRARGIDSICNLGDIVGKGGNSDRAIDICREYCTVNLRGNWDDFVTRPEDEGLWTQFVRRQVGEERLRWLQTLPGTYDFWLSGLPVRLYHASQIGIYHRIYSHASRADHLAMFENTPFTGFDNDAPRIVGYGDIHDAYMLMLEPGHKTLFNAGSVGNPLDMPLATYVVLSGALESRQRAGWSLEFVRLEYDVERAIQDARDAGAPEVEELAVELRSSTYRARWRAEQALLSAQEEAGK